MEVTEVTGSIRDTRTTPSTSSLRFKFLVDTTNAAVMCAARKTAGDKVCATRAVPVAAVPMATDITVAATMAAGKMTAGTTDG